MTLVIDENGVYYRVPICCINEPSNYNANVPDSNLKSKAKPSEIIFEVTILMKTNYIQALKIRSAKGDITLSVSNYISVADFKKKYVEKVNDTTFKVDNLRLFCLGKELKDELFLYTYDIIDGIIVQAQIKK